MTLTHLVHDVKMNGESDIREKSLKKLARTVKNVAASLCEGGRWRGKPTEHYFSL